MKNKLLIFFLLFVWLLQNGLSMIYFQMVRNECHHINFQLTKNKGIGKKICYFSFESIDQITWEVYGKEFSNDSSLYDVLAISNLNGKIIVKCFKDKKEAKILHHIKLLQKHNRRGKGNNPESKNTNFFNYFQAPQKLVFTNYQTKEKNHIILQNCKAQLDFYDIFKPPPQA
jgi:hypothetical protein